MSIFRLIFMSLPLVFVLNVSAQSVGVLEEVVVTAQKKEENLQDTPIAVTAITESVIDDLDIAKFINFLNKNDIKDKEQAQSYYNQYKKNYNVKGSFDDVWNNMKYDQNKFKYETTVPTKNYAKWMGTVKPVNYVNDYAKIIDNATESLINKRLSDYEKKIPLHDVCIDAFGGASAGGSAGGVCRRGVCTGPGCRAAHGRRALVRLSEGR